MMKLIFLAIAVVIIYKVILDNYINQESVEGLIRLDFLRNIGNIVLITILCLSIRETVKRMRESESISKNLRDSKNQET